MKTITGIIGLDPKWQEGILQIMIAFEKDKDKLSAIEKINDLTGLGILYSSEAFKKLEVEFLIDRKANLKLN